MFPYAEPTIFDAGGSIESELRIGFGVAKGCGCRKKRTSESAPFTVVTRARPIVSQDRYNA